MRLEDCPGQILRLGHQAEPDGRDVLLVEVDEVRGELRPLPDQDRQNAGRLGIERATVADLGRAQQAAQMCDHLERRDPGALVDGQDAGAGALAHDVPPSRASLTTASSAAVASSSVPRTVQPAALACPPPPKRWAMPFTATSPFPRRLALTTPSASSRRSRATFTLPIDRG